MRLATTGADGKRPPMRQSVTGIGRLFTMEYGSHHRFRAPVAVRVLTPPAVIDERLIVRLAADGVDDVLGPFSGQAGSENATLLEEPSQTRAEAVPTLCRDLLSQLDKRRVAGRSWVQRSQRVPERPVIQRIIDEPGPVRQLQLYAATHPGLWSRVGPLAHTAGTEVEVMQRTIKASTDIARTPQEIFDYVSDASASGAGSPVSRPKASTAGRASSRARSLASRIDFNRTAPSDLIQLSSCSTP